MPNMNWSKLNSMQLGRYGEYYAKMEFTSYGYDVYTSEVDDHGVDFIARDVKTDVFYKVQVKSMFKGNYIYMRKDKLSPDDQTLLVCFLHFSEGELPEVYIIPVTAWKTPNAVFVDREYTAEQKSKPEWGISYSKKNRVLLEEYKAEKYFNTK